MSLSIQTLWGVFSGVQPIPVDRFDPWAPGADWGAWAPQRFTPTERMQVRLVAKQRLGCSGCRLVTRGYRGLAACFRGALRCAYIQARVRCARNCVCADAMWRAGQGFSSCNNAGLLVALMGTSRKQYAAGMQEGWDARQASGSGADECGRVTLGIADSNAHILIIVG